MNKLLLGLFLFGVLFSNAVANHSANDVQPSHGMIITSATWGGRPGHGSNVTDKISRLCGGEASCSYFPTSEWFGGSGPYLVVKGICPTGFVFMHHDGYEDWPDALECRSTRE